MNGTDALGTVVKAATEHRRTVIAVLVITAAMTIALRLTWPHDAAEPMVVWADVKELALMVAAFFFGRAVGRNNNGD